jgi:hypothetical protein
MSAPRTHGQSGRSVEATYQDAFAKRLMRTPRSGCLRSRKGLIGFLKDCFNHRYKPLLARVCGSSPASLTTGNANPGIALGYAS